MLSTYSDLAGKTAVITGGSRGIGAETARQLAAQQAQVCVVGRSKPDLDEVVAQITDAGGTAVAAVADVTSAAELIGVRELVEFEFGRVDVLGVFAGGLGRPTPSAELPEQLWRQVLDSDLTSAFLTVQAFLPMMLAQGSGSIVTMSSSAGRQPSQANLAYGVAKAGIVMMTRHLAAELGPQGIRVNSLAPSSILTEKVAANMPQPVQQQVAAAHPLRRLGETADVAQAALFLASDASSYLSGITIDVAGGRITN
ncbi:SDR family oxidoreductase [Nocardia yunnanensis]|uniref:3-oxoacyl-[acyl-carrier-protein] reductase MabA n=1 Tax=Nocardia yunnanensis TaxID=2382165 RepID=A0A386ZJL3_9NOCA|nr:SDR family NAD(P)-dependent oxidoreductase [Nocardia yunnanensis]AYF77463.1 SDR family oxidoreductase [Nocardia yunnanensis]